MTLLIIFFYGSDCSLSSTRIFIPSPVDVYKICLIGETTLNCVLAFSFSKYLIFSSLFLHVARRSDFSFSAASIPTIDIRVY